MKDPAAAIPDNTELRRRAEAELKPKAQHADAIPDAETTLKLLHELQVHRIELEMQNEELRQARAEVEAAKEDYLELFDFAPVGYFTFDRDGGICQVNLAGATMLGMDRARLIGRNFKEFLEGDNRRIFTAFLGRIFSSADKQQCYLDIADVKTASRFIHIEARARENGQSSRAMMIDLSERKRVEQELKDSEAKYRSIFENSRAALLVNAPPAWGFTEVNKSALQMFGAKNEAEFHSLTPWEISPEFQPDGLRSSDKAKQMVEIAIREGSHLFEWTHKRLDGSTFPAEVLLTRMKMKGRIFIHGALRDISARKNLEKEVLERRIETEQLVKRQVAVHTAAAIAHELNQPLLALASYGEAVLMMLKDADPDLDKIRRAVEAGEKQAIRAGQSIRDLIEFLSKEEFPTEALDLNREILDVLNIARSEHDLQFQTVLSLEEGLPRVQANRVHLQKVLHNLLHNGIESMQQACVPQSTITVTVRTRKDENFAQVTIQDNGPGISAEVAQRMFESFFTTKGTGIGMGLAISRSLIEANGGQLWYDPETGPGATFHLTLPFAS